MKFFLIKIGKLIILILIILSTIVYLLQKQECNDYRKRGILLIDKIETFKKVNKRLPNDVQELGIEVPMNDGPYYEKKDSINYVVFFTIGFDNVKVYCSDKKEWRYR